MREHHETVNPEGPGSERHPWAQRLKRIGYAGLAIAGVEFGLNATVVESLGLAVAGVVTLELGAFAVVAGIVTESIGDHLSDSSRP